MTTVAMTTAAARRMNAVAVRTHRLSSLETKVDVCARHKLMDIIVSSLNQLTKFIY